jgi:hypothetical protein
MEIHRVVPKKIIYLATLGFRILYYIRCRKLRSAVTLEVTGRSRTDFACLMSHIVPICTPKVMEIHGVVPKKITHLATLGFFVRNKTLAVTGRSRPEFACLINRFVSLCTPKIMEIHGVVPKKITHLATLGFRICKYIRCRDLRSVVTLEVTGRSRTDFACLISRFVSLCTPKIMEIHRVVPKKIIYFATLGFRIC